MFSRSIQNLKAWEGEMVSIYCNGEIVSYRDVLSMWIDDEVFRVYFMDLLTETLYLAIRWEVPPLTIHSMDQPFEFVVINSPELTGSADRAAFSDLFDQIPVGGVGAFPNLGGDAIMILPGPVDTRTGYGHLLSFLNSAPATQLHSFWQLVGKSVIRRLGHQPLWLNTAGGGVSWLHVRLDDKPKYYVYKPYKLLSDLP